MVDCSLSSTNARVPLTYLAGPGQPQSLIAGLLLTNPSGNGVWSTETTKQPKEKCNSRVNSKFIFLKESKFVIFFTSRLLSLLFLQLYCRHDGTNRHRDQIEASGQNLQTWGAAQSHLFAPSSFLLLSLIVSFLFRRM